MEKSKSYTKLEPGDFTSNPVWRRKPARDLRAGEDESWVEPVIALPVKQALNCFFGVQVLCADGSSELCLIAETEPLDPTLNAANQQFRFFRHGEWRCWANESYWLEPARTDPNSLASFLGKKSSEVFPFAYDLTGLLVGDQEVVRRSVTPSESSAEAIDPAEAAIRAAMQKAKKLRPK